MTEHFFLSYSKHDALEFARRLRHDLKAGKPSFSLWMDEKDVRPGSDWADGEIAEAIQDCKGFLFVISRESVKNDSWCNKELIRAFDEEKKRIIPIKIHEVRKTLFRLGGIQYIDFTGEYPLALNKLRECLASFTPKAASIPNKPPWSSLPRAKAKSSSRSIINPHPPIIINYPPIPVPSHFQDRQNEIALIGEFIADDTERLLFVVGREGSGKTTVVCRFLDSLQRGNCLDHKVSQQVDVIVYPSSTSYGRVSWPSLFDNLCRLLPNKKRKSLEILFKQQEMTTAAKMKGLLAALSDRRIVVMLDHFDDVLDPITGDLLDSDLDEALRTLLKDTAHRVNAILTSQITPKNLILVQPAQQRSINLGYGLPTDHAETVLREKDRDGTLGLRYASKDLLAEACQRTLGNPRALEVLYACLVADRDTSLEEILQETSGLFPEKVLDELVGKAYQKLDSISQMIMQALAVYARPVSPDAVNYLLQPYLQEVNSRPALGRLVNMQLVRKEEGSYLLHETDRKYVRSRIPQGQLADRQRTDPAPFTLFALLHRGADFFKQLATSSEKAIDDLVPRLAEFDLRYEGQDYESAAHLLVEIEEHLFERGDYPLVAELHERLHRPLESPRLNRHQFLTLGWVYQRLGKLDQAINSYEEGLRYAQRIEDQEGERRCLGNLAICFEESGDLDLAFIYGGLALILSDQTGDCPRQAHVLNTLSDCFAYVGMISEAIQCCEQSLALAQERRWQKREVEALANMGQHYGELGEAKRAMEACERSRDLSKEYCDISKDIEFQLRESVALRNLAELHVDKDEFEHAAQLYKQAFQLADAAQSAQLQQTIRTGFALALLFSGDLKGARASIDKGCQYDVPMHNCEAFTVLGVIAQRQGDNPAATESFQKALQLADAMLRKTPQLYRAFDAKGLALSGLVISKGCIEYVEDAVEAYQAARKINKDVGIVRRMLRLFDELARGDPRLAPVREAVAGIESNSVVG